MRFRFAFWTASLILTVTFIFGALVYFSVEHELMVSLDESLRVNALQALAAIDMENGRLALPETFIEPPESADMRPQGFVLRLISPDGQTLRSFGADSALVTLDATLLFGTHQPSLTSVVDQTSMIPLRVYTLPVEDNSVITGFIQVGRSLQGQQETLSHLFSSLLIGIPLVLIAATLGGYGLAARALAPIDQIARTARHISAEDFSARLNLPETNDEVGRLAATFDVMLARLADAFQRERRFTADASHELRTPLATMRAILGVTLERRRTALEYRLALQDLDTQTARLQSLAENLLLLARDDYLPSGSPQPIDLGILISDVVASLEPLANSRSLCLRCQVQNGLIIAGNADGLIRVFANLLDNAIKYTDCGGITVEAGAVQPSLVQVKITDTGIGIEQAHLPHIFERFYRVEQARSSQGAGLGLAIALEIVRAHHGSIDVDSAPGTGTQFVVVFPREGWPPDMRGEI